jgi:hypothetical protein
VPSSQGRIINWVHWAHSPKPTKLTRAYDPKISDDSNNKRKLLYFNWISLVTTFIISPQGTKSHNAVYLLWRLYTRTCDGPCEGVGRWHHGAAPCALVVRASPGVATAMWRPDQEVRVTPELLCPLQQMKWNATLIMSDETERMWKKRQLQILTFSHTSKSSSQCRICEKWTRDLLNTKW